MCREDDFLPFGTKKMERKKKNHMSSISTVFSFSLWKKWDKGWENAEIMYVPPKIE